MSVVGRVVRATVLRPGRTWRIPLGLARGLRIEVDPSAPLHTYLGSAEIEIARHIRRLARPGARCFDVGGHDGYYAMVLARLTGAEVVSFEFDETCTARMRRNLALNPPLGERVRILETYVAHERVESPRADTLDNLLARGDVFAPGLIKIDVEGAETAVLSGATELLRSARPDLVIETHSASLEADCLRLLRSVGYSLQVVSPRRWLAENRGHEQNRWIVAEGPS
jgi:predicted nicotinamide N-methyase